MLYIINTSLLILSCYIFVDIAHGNFTAEEPASSEGNLQSGVLVDKTIRPQLEVPGSLLILIIKTFISMNLTLTLKYLYFIDFKTFLLIIRI